MYPNLHSIYPPSVSGRQALPLIKRSRYHDEMCVDSSFPAVLLRFRVSRIVIVDGQTIAAVSGGPGLATGNNDNEVMVPTSASLNTVTICPPRPGYPGRCRQGNS